MVLVVQVPLVLTDHVVVGEVSRGAHDEGVGEAAAAALGLQTS